VLALISGAVISVYFFFGQIIPRGSEEPQESAAPDSEDGPGHFGS